MKKKKVLSLVKFGDLNFLSYIYVYKKRKRSLHNGIKRAISSRDIGRH